MAVLLSVIEGILLLAGIALVLYGMSLYATRNQDWLSPFKIFFNRVNDILVSEYRWMRYGTMLLLAAVVLRFARHLLL